MNIIEFEQVRSYMQLSKHSHILGHDLKNQKPRTLIYGYNIERETFHVFLDERGYIRIYYYDHNNKILSNYNEIDEYSNFHYVPNKRVYPESCDFEFCTLLCQHGVDIPFTAFDSIRYDKVRNLNFHGEIFN